MKRATFLALPIALLAAQSVAEESQVSMARSEAAPVFDHSVSGMGSDGTMLTFTVVSVATTVTFDRLSGDPLTVATSVALEPDAYVCDGPEMRNQSAQVRPDQIIFTYDCVRADR
jgi:hypothetical protein